MINWGYWNTFGLFCSHFVFIFDPYASKADRDGFYWILAANVATDEIPDWRVHLFHEHGSDPENPPAGVFYVLVVVFDLSLFFVFCLLTRKFSKGLSLVYYVYVGTLKSKLKDWDGSAWKTP